MPNVGTYLVEIANDPGAAELRFEAGNGIEAAMRAFARLADGWPETIEIVRRSARDGLTITVSAGEEQLTLLVSRVE